MRPFTDVVGDMRPQSTPETQHFLAQKLLECRLDLAERRDDRLKNAFRLSGLTSRLLFDSMSSG